MSILLREVAHERLTERLDAIFAAELAARGAKQPRWANRFHASSLAGCLRETGYSLLHVPPARHYGQRSWQLAAEIGDHIHETLQKDLKATGMVYQHPTFGPAIELPLDKSYDPALADELAACNVSGRLDLVLEFGDTVVLGDIKTTSAADLRDLSEMGTRERGYFEKKLAKWQTQLLLYLHFFATPDGRKAKTAFIYQIDRGDVSNRKRWELRYDEAAIRPDLERLKAATLLVKAGQLPPPERERGSCKFCGYVPICPAWAKESAKVEA